MAAAPAKLASVMYWLRLPSQSGLLRTCALTTGPVATSKTATRKVRLAQNG